MLSDKYKAYQIQMISECKKSLSKKKWIKKYITDKDITDFSDMVYYLRIKKGLSQGEVAKKSGLFANSISQYETRKIIPTILSAEYLADFFGVSLDYLCCREVK